MYKRQEYGLCYTADTCFNQYSDFEDCGLYVGDTGKIFISQAKKIKNVYHLIYECSNPVSYTHLDVYKRQAVYFDDIRLLMGALPVNDIASVMNGKADLMIQKWSCLLYTSRCV